MQSSTGGQVWFMVDEDGMPEGVTVAPKPEHEFLACPMCGNAWFAASIFLWPDGDVAGHGESVACLHCGCVLSLF